MKEQCHDCQRWKDSQTPREAQLKVKLKKRNQMPDSGRIRKVLEKSQERKRRARGGRRCGREKGEEGAK